MPASRPRGRRHLLVALVAVAALLGPLAGPAAAGRWIERTAVRLRDNPVYVDPAADPRIGPVSITRLRARVAAAGTPVYVAVLPGQARVEGEGSMPRLAVRVAAATGFTGTYLVVAGGQPGAGSNTLGRGRAAAAAKAAFSAYPGDLDAALLDFVGRVAAAAGGPAVPTTAPPPEAPAPPNRDGVTRIVLVVALLAAAVVLIDLFAKRRGGRRRLQSGQEFTEVRAAAEEDLRALNDDLRSLDVDLRAEEADNPAAVREYTRAYEEYERAATAFEAANTPQDLTPVSTALEAGRYSMVAAQALFERGERPRRRPPCFFDTRHGPSIDDVGWEPPGGPPRPVPACAACTSLIASGNDPPVRKIRTGGRRVPFYEAPTHFESWFGGYFGGAAADLVAGFELGRALDDGFAGGLNTSGGGYGYVPVSFADTGQVDSGGAVTAEHEAAAWTPITTTEVDDEQDGSRTGSR